ncbi:hypothetical protein ACVWWP_001592 [Bradyrhizobium sp. LM3.6]
MKRLIFAGILLLASGTMSLADGLFWVVGNNATGKCSIVTSNPVIIGDVWFGDAPLQVQGRCQACPFDDPRLSRAHIRRAKGRGQHELGRQAT